MSTGRTKTPARTKTPGGPLELRPQTGHDGNFQAPSRTGTAASHRSRVLRSPVKDTEEKDEELPGRSELSSPRGQEAQVLAFADAEPGQSELFAESDHHSRPSFDAIKRAKKEAKLKQLEAERCQEHERQQRLKELAEKRSKEYWDRKQQEEGEERRNFEAGESRRRAQREEQQRLAEEKLADKLLLHSLLDSARKKNQVSGPQFLEDNEGTVGEVERNASEDPQDQQKHKGSSPSRRTGGEVDGGASEDPQDQQKHQGSSPSRVQSKERGEQVVRFADLDAVDIAGATARPIEEEVVLLAGAGLAEDSTRPAQQEVREETREVQRLQQPAEKPRSPAHPPQLSAGKEVKVTGVNEKVEQASPRKRKSPLRNAQETVATRKMDSNYEGEKRGAPEVLPKISQAHTMLRTVSAEKPRKRQLLHLAAFKEVVKSKFGTVLDAFVFFDHMKVNFVSTMNLKRGLVKLEAKDLVSEFDALVRDFEWKCVDHGKIHCSEFIHLLQWHDIHDLNKELSAARLAFDRQTRAEQNKAISIKAAKPYRVTPVCDKLREILKAKYQSVAAFMVIADMDIHHVINFRDMTIAFKKEGIEGIDVEELAVELSDPSFPPTAVKTQAFSKMLRWHSLEEVEEKLKEERINIRHERNKYEKGLPQIPIPAHSLPFFKERPEVHKVSSIMQSHFDNVADAFVFFDTDNSGDITRVKMAHGLQRLQNLADGEIALDIDKLMPELQNLQFTGGAVNAAGFISNFRWHEKFPDVEDAVWTARRKKVAKDAIIPAQRHPRFPKDAFRGGGQQKKVLYSVMKKQAKSSLPGILGGTVSMDDWLRNKELHMTLNQLATMRIAAEDMKLESNVVDAEDGERIQERMDASLAASSGAVRGHAAERDVAKATIVYEDGNVLTVASELEPGDGASGKRFARARVDVDGRSRPSRLADAGQRAPPNMYDKQLQNGRHNRRLKLKTKERGGTRVPHPPNQVAPPTPLGALKSVLQERGFQDAIDAFSFFDSDQKGSITRGDLQKGLLALRIFKVTAKAVPFPKIGLDGIDRMDLLQFLVLCAWDGSLEQVLAMQRSEIEARLEDSYNRYEDIRRAALHEAAKSTDRSNADLKAQVLQGLTDLPNLFDLPPHRQTDGSHTDRAHLRNRQHGKYGQKGNDRTDGSQTERFERHGHARVQRTKASSKSRASGGGKPPTKIVGADHVQVPVESNGVQPVGSDVAGMMQDTGASPPPGGLQAHDEALWRNPGDHHPHTHMEEPAISSVQHAADEPTDNAAPHADAEAEVCQAHLRQLRVPNSRSHGIEIVPHGHMIESEPAGREALGDRVAARSSGTQEESTGDTDWDILDNDTRVMVPKDPRGALLAEKFLSDKIKRLETKHYVYEGPVNSDGKPHGQGIKWYAPHKQQSPGRQQGDESRQDTYRKRKILKPPPDAFVDAAASEHWQIGRFSNGKLTGSGMMRLPDGTYYFGDFKEGKRHGAGMNISASGIIYEGEFFNDIRDGCGCMWAKSGPAYFGEWHLDRRSGSGLTGTCNASMVERMQDKPLLPNSVVQSAIQFETFVVVSKNHVRGSTNKMLRKDHELMQEAILWNATQSRTTACEGWNVAIGCISRLQEYAKGIDLSIAPQAANLQLSQLFYDHAGELNSLPSIPLWVLIQPAYECLSPSAQSPVGSPKSSPRSPSRLARGKGFAEVAAQGGPASKGKMPAVSFVK